MPFGKVAEADQEGWLGAETDEWGLKEDYTKWTVESGMTCLKTRWSRRHEELGNNFDMQIGQTYEWAAGYIVYATPTSRGLA